MNLLRALSESVPFSILRILSTSNYSAMLTQDRMFIVTSLWHPGGYKSVLLFLYKQFWTVWNWLSLIIIYVYCICSHMEPFFESRCQPIRSLKIIWSWLGMRLDNTDANDGTYASMSWQYHIVYLGGTCNAYEL